MASSSFRCGMSAYTSFPPLPNSIIRQRNTFSRLLTTREGLQLILDSYNVFTRFLNVVTAFGFKRDDDHRAWDGYQASTSEGEYGRISGILLMHIQLVRCIRIPRNI